jgi:sterol 3beta-glucosyltransferase
MHIMILTAGSRGDVQPFVALGVGLQQAGHSVTLCTSSRFQAMITEYGLTYGPMDDQLLMLSETPEGRAALESGGSALKLIKKVRPLLRRMLDDTWNAASGAQAIVYHPKALAGYHIAEKLRIPGFLSLPLPLFTPTGAFPIPLLSGARLGTWLNRQSYKINALMTVPFAGIINDWRKQVLNLPPRRRLASELIRADGKPVPVLYPYSTQIVPRPHDWPATTIATGYWFLDQPQAWQPPQELVEFLTAGPAPVYIGFGSMAGRDPQQLTRTVLAGIVQSGQRAVIATGWGGLVAADLPEQVFAIDAAPHDWLFPRCTAVVHHGGAGTTAAGLRAGKPALLCPFFGDQPFWGRRIHQLGIGPRPIPQKRLTAPALATALQTIATDSAMRQRAAELGAAIRAEDGVTRAVEFIDRYAA